MNIFLSIIVEIVSMNKFITQPEDTVYEPNDIQGYAYLECFADAYPQVSYEWQRERDGVNTTINPDEDPRYSLINGSLIIHELSSEQQDDGNYQCKASNDFGLILSNIASLSFGCELSIWNCPFVF